MTPQIWRVLQRKRHFFFPGRTDVEPHLLTPQILGARGAVRTNPHRQARTNGDRLVEAALLLVKYLNTSRPLAIALIYKRTCFSSDNWEQNENKYKHRL